MTRELPQEVADFLLERPRAEHEIVAHVSQTLGDNVQVRPPIWYGQDGMGCAADAPSQWESLAVRCRLTVRGSARPLLPTVCRTQPRQCAVH